MKLRTWNHSGPFAAGLLGSAPVPFLALSARAASTAAISSGLCRSSSHPALAARLTRDIHAARRDRLSTVAVRVDDPGKRLGCWLHSARHFDSASVVKVTILGALLRKALDHHRYLTDTEAARASAMITRSDNDAASALWAALGRSYLQHFLHLAAMKQTVLGPGGYWGLTQITAHDQVLLLRLLLHQEPSTRPRLTPLRADPDGPGHPLPTLGCPGRRARRLTVHVKNGWMPRPDHGWRMNSIGCFTGRRGDYAIVVLTQDNPTLAYGIGTIEAIARAIHRDLNP